MRFPRTVDFATPANVARWWICLLSLGLAGPAAAAPPPVLKVLQSSGTASNLVRHGDFEQLANGRLAGWPAYQLGFSVAPGGGREGTQGIVCHNDQPRQARGASQTIVLNQTQPVPLLVRGWSKAEGVSGSPSANYSIYVDLVYQDGSPLWGQSAPFRCGTHDWELREVRIVPDQPVRQMTVYCLFREHTGRVWFDDVRVEELRAAGGASWFQGVLVSRPPGAAAPARGAHRTYATRDGLRLEMQGEEVTGGSWPHGSRSGGFFVRDVARNSDFHGFASGVCEPLGLRLTHTIREAGDHLVVEGRLQDTTGHPRAVTLVFALPAGGEPPRAPGSLGGSGPAIRPFPTYGNETQVRCGATGTMALYPLMPVWQGEEGLALGLDMGAPAIYRTGLDRQLEWLWLAYDFGLSPATRRFPQAADFRLVVFKFPGAGGFRQAWQKYMDIFPDYFLVRSTNQGIWMPFTDVSTVEGWQDFGFKYHEGNNNVKFDDAHDILSFRYTEPMTWWMPMPKTAPRTAAAAHAIRDELLASGKPAQRVAAQVTQAAAMHDDTGQPALLFRSEPWCDGVVWSLNPNPHLPGPVNFAQWHWNAELKRKLYGAEASGQLDGEYLDSLEGYVTADLNYRQDHFAHTTVPLVFATGTHQLALHKGLAAYEFTRWLAADVHGMGKLMFANSVPYRFTFLCPWLDVMGTETDWNRGGRWQPPADATMSLWRFMSGAKPYVLLMNTHYDAFTPDLVEKYFQRCAFYGFFPSMFSHNASENPYWKHPAWYNRDRPLFRKYVPIIKQTAEAGWRPVTGVHSENPAFWIERFGADQAPHGYITVFNPGDRRLSGRIYWMGTAFQKRRALVVNELVSGREIRLSRQADGWDCELGPEQVAVFRVQLEQ